MPKTTHPSCPPSSVTDPQHSVKMVGTQNLPYMALLNILDLTKITNEPILHDTSLSPMSTKIPSNIPKFDGKMGEDMENNVMTFHIWYSSNNIIDEKCEKVHR